MTTAAKVRMPRKRAKLADSCTLCPQRIKVGSWIALHFASNSWVHVGCLVREMHKQDGPA